MTLKFQGPCLCSLFVAGCSVLLVTAVPVLQIVIGAVYMGSCPLAPGLPVYLLVSGVGALLILCLLALPGLVCPDVRSGCLWTLWVVSLGLVYLSWFLYGSVLIYSVYPVYMDGPSVPGNYTSSAGASSGQVEPSALISSAQMGPSVLVSSGPLGPSAAVSSGPLGPSAAVSSGPVGPSAAVSSGPLGPSAAVSSGPLGPSAAVSSGPVGPSAAVSPGPLCPRFLYLFAFWSHTLVYVFAGSVLLLLLCLCCFMKLCDVVVKHLIY